MRYNVSYSISYDVMTTRTLDKDDVFVEADNEQQAKKLLEEMAESDIGGYDGYFNYLELHSLEPMTYTSVEEEEITAAINEQNIAVDRSGGDYWNYDDIEEVLD